ncbi:MAG: O-methyltransferase [Bacteroidia bacterium]|nr:O-methyltransferase [Bacteroidia bacterium]MCF8427411.1 O-methyltransferase [Bacteroidia bacterium]MCF8447290.1 O-methyltransferase [Bacteroidia bacterium]
MDFLSDDLQDYCEQHSSNEPDVLKKLNRQTHAQVLQPRMLSGHLQGRFLAMISKLVQPKTILEIGTYTGYSALCLAEGLTEGGKLITIDVNPELEDMVHQYIEEAGMQDKVQMIIGDAYQIIRTLPQNFDLVFIDADKASYSKYYDLVIERLNPGGLILADNVLWSGKIVEEKALAKDKDTQLLDAFNKKVKADPRVECMLLPLRDGMMMVRKK